MTVTRKIYEGGEWVAVPLGPEGDEHLITVVEPLDARVRTFNAGLWMQQPRSVANRAMATLTETMFPGRDKPSLAIATGIARSVLDVATFYQPRDCQAVQHPTRVSRDRLLVLSNADQPVVINPAALRAVETYAGGLGIGCDLSTHRMFGYYGATVQPGKTEVSLGQGATTMANNLDILAGALRAVVDYTNATPPPVAP